MIQLTREVRFSVSPNAAAVSTERPVNSWAGILVPELAPFVRLRATLEGQPAAVSGYLCDIKYMDDLLEQTALPLVRQMLLERGPALSAAVLLCALWQRLPVEFIPGARLVRLQWLPSPYLFYTLMRENPGMVQLTEQFEFSAAHRLHCAEWSAEQNQAVFGKCNNCHGHNYIVEVTVADTTAAVAGQGTRPWVAHIVKQRILDRFDHKLLNEDTEEFRQLNPTVEHIAYVIWNLLAPALAPVRLLHVRLYETPKTWADYRGE